MSNSTTRVGEGADLSVRADLELVASVNRELLMLLLLEPRSNSWPLIADIIRARPDCIPFLVQACPFALFDIRYSDAAAWASFAMSSISYDGYSIAQSTRSCAVLGAASILSWHLARTSFIGGKLLLGASNEVLRTIASLSLTHVQQLPFARANWLQPRWSDHPDIWEGIVAMGASPPVNPLLLRSRTLTLFFGCLNAP